MHQQCTKYRVLRSRMENMRKVSNAESMMWMPVTEEYL